MEPTSSALLVLQSFMGIVAMTGLVLAAEEAQRQRAQRELQVLSQSLDKQVQERTEELSRANVQLERSNSELARTNAELQEFNELAVGRELKMIELKEEINQLLQAAGQPPRYDVSDEIVTEQGDG